MSVCTTIQRNKFVHSIDPPISPMYHAEVTKIMILVMLSKDRTALVLSEFIFASFDLFPEPAEGETVAEVA